MTTIKKVTVNSKESSTTEPVKKTPGARQFTYIGAGESSPYVITLMGKQKFVRGELTEVTDHEILDKIGQIPTFVEGPVEASLLHEIDQKGKEAFEAQKAQDLITNQLYNKKHRGE